MHRISVLMLAAVVAAGGCRHGGGATGGGTGTPPAQRSQAEALFWEVFGNRQHARVGELIAALDAATRERPDDARAWLLLGMTHTWQIAEPELNHPTNPDEANQLAVAALNRYHALAPDDARVASWLGPLLVGRGHGMHDAATHIPPGPQHDAVAAQAEAAIAAGLAALDEGVAKEPRFNLFGRLLVTAQYPRGSDRFQSAVADVLAVHQARLGLAPDGTHDVGPLIAGASACDPAHPKPWPYPAPSADTIFRRDPRCWNSWKVPFEYEGFWLASGDVMLKAGRVDTARAMWKNAQRLSSYAHWPYAFAVETRLAQADAWAQKLANDDPADDPPLVYQSAWQCGACHSHPDIHPTMP
jgi:hypothetical protein